MLRTLLLCSLLFAAPLALPACGGGSSSDETREYVGTQGPGDLWTWRLDPATNRFTATNDTTGLTYEGDWSVLPSGFLLLTISGSSDPSTAVGDKAYALEVPDTVLVVKPAGSGDNLIIAARTGTCFAGPTLTVNHVDVTDSGWSATSTAYGRSVVTVTGATLDVAVEKFLLDGTPNGTESVLGLTCSGGLITDPASSEVIVVAPTGAFITDRGPSDGGVIGMEAPAAPVDLDDVASREYRSFQYKDGSTGTDDSRPNWARSDGAGGLIGGDYVDIEANIEDTTNNATIEFTDQIQPGIVNGRLDDGAGFSDMVFMVNVIAGRYFIFGVGVDTNDGLPYNFVALEQ